MKSYLSVACCALLLVGCATEKKEMAMPKSGAHAHLGHVDTGWKDTPGKKGPLPTATAEARVAIQHARFAVQRNNLKWMRTHTWHVVHAVDPRFASQGPGKGYGVRRAASGVALQINLAATSKDASRNVKVYTPHVATSANNTVVPVDRIVVLARKVQGTRSSAAARRHSQEILVLSRQLLIGRDANDDGRITWRKGEGGLNTAERHMGLIRAGEAKK